MPQRYFFIPTAADNNYAAPLPNTPTRLQILANALFQNTPCNQTLTTSKLNIYCTTDSENIENAELKTQ